MPCDIVDEERAGRAAVVGSGDRSEALLPSLQAAVLVMLRRAPAAQDHRGCPSSLAVCQAHAAVARAGQRVDLVDRV
jgi:hypothetical protein